MPYAAEITFHRSSPNEFTYEDKFATLADAVAFIEHHTSGMGSVTAYINNKPVQLKNCKVVDSDGEPFCTNQAWHDVFANFHYPAIRTVATNPATHEAIGAPL